MNQTSCLSRIMLIKFANGELFEEQASSVSEHLASCHRCQTQVEAVDAQPESFAAEFRFLVNAARFAGQPEIQRAMSARLSDADSSWEKTSAPTHVERGPSMPTQLNEYEILSPIGQGGMGAVYRARHVKLHRDVAVKLLTSDRISDKQSVARFYREMEAVGKLDHPNIVRATDAGEADGTHYLVMELVDGSDLSKLVRRHGPLAVPDACEIARQMAIGLEHVHQHGLVHRDIKPSNVLLTSAGRVKILDLGLARLRDYVGTEEALTREGQTLGTFDYIAPEQLSDSSQVDIRADIYSLGATLYKLLCGAAPFADSKFDTLSKKVSAILTTQAAPISQCCTDVPDALAGLIDVCLSKDPDARPAAPADVAQSLEPWVADSDLTTLIESLETAREPVERQTQAAESTSRLAAAETNGDWREASEVSQPEPGIVTPRSTKPRGFRPRVAIMSLAVVGVIMAAITFTWMTDKCELVIHCMNSDVQVLVKRVTDGTIVKHWSLSQGENRWTIRSGEYEIVLLGGDVERMEIDDNCITLTRGGEVIASMYRKGAKPPPMTPTIEPPLITVKPGEPLSPTAIVRSPRVLADLLSWTIVLRQPRGPIYAVAYSPDGKLIASAGHDSTIRIWNAETRRLVKVLLGHILRVSALGWSPDVRYLASSGQDREIQIWDVKSGRLVHTIPPGTGIRFNRPLAWSPKGHSLALADGDDVVLWSPESRTMTRLTRHSGGVKTLAWSPNGETLASGGDDTIYLWDTASPKVRELRGQGNVMALAWSPDGKTLISYSDSGELCFWRTDHETLLDRFEARADAFGVHTLVWSRVGETIVSVAGSKGILLWDSQWRRQIQVPGAVPLSVDISPDGKTVVCGKGQGRITLFDVASDSIRMQELGSSISATADIQWSPDGTSIAVLRDPKNIEKSRDSKIWLYDVRTLSRIRDFNDSVYHSAPQAWSPDGRLLAGIQYDEIVLWDKTGREVATLKGHATTVHSLSWARNGLLASGDQNGQVRVWDVGAAQPVHSLNVAGWATVCFAPNGRLLATRGRDDKTVRLWDLDSGESRHTLEDGGSIAFKMAWSPDGRLLAYGSGRLFDLDTGDVKTLEPWDTWYQAVLAWSPDGKSLISGNLDPRASATYSLNLASGERRTLLGVPSTSASFSRDGSFVACADRSGTVRFCEAASGQVRAVIRLLSRDQYVAISPDGHYHGSPGIEEELRYVAQTEQGQETLTPAEFANKYGWVNDPDNVRLVD